MGRWVGGTFSDTGIFHFFELRWVTLYNAPDDGRLFIEDVDESSALLLSCDYFLLIHLLRAN